MAGDAFSLAYLALNSITAATFLALAGILARANSHRLLNWLLAVLLADVAVNFAAQAALFATADPFVLVNAGNYAAVTGAIIPLAYFAFLPIALQTPLVSPFRPRAVRWALLGSAGALLAFIILAPNVTSDLLVKFALPIGAISVTSFFYATASSVDGWRRALHGSLSRRRARAYFVAFVFLDLSGLFYYLPPLLAISQAARDASQNALSAIAATLFATLLTRALLRDQLFDFDLKLKLSVKRGTVAAAFVAVFFVVTQIAQNYLASFGYVLGGVAAGLLLFAMAPLQRAAERVASAAVPGAVDSPEYRLVKKRDVYRAAVEGALDDGVVTDKERSVLARLADQLGLSVTETLDIEREARGDTGPEPAGA